MSKVDELIKKHEMTLWEFRDFLGASDLALKEQLELLAQLVIEALEWHAQYEEAHTDIREKITSLKKEYEHHRHDLNQAFSGEPE
jgi:hypothetical protein